MSEENIALWNRHQKPHKDALKSFKKGGGFSGTAIDPMWVVREATVEWGPAGSGWGYNVIKEDYVTGAPLKDGGNEILHVVRIELWYTAEGGGRASIEAYGQTMFVGSNKYGSFTDDEAPKKSLTDAVSKGLSWLGFGSAVHMGMFDGNKYVDLRADAEPPQPKSNPAPKEEQEKPDGKKRIIKYLEDLEGLVGEEEAQKRWVTLLKHSDHAEGALSLGDIKDFSKLWRLSDEVKDMVEATAATIEEQKKEEN